MVIWMSIFIDLIIWDENLTKSTNHPQINSEVHSDKMILYVLNFRGVEEQLASGIEPGVEELFGERTGADAVPASYEELYGKGKLFKATT